MWYFISWGHVSPIDYTGVKRYKFHDYNPTTNVMKTLINSQKRQETQQHYYYNEKINTIAIYLIYQCRKESAELSLCSKKLNQ